MKRVILILTILLPVLITTACFTKQAAEINTSPSPPVQTASSSDISPANTEPANTIFTPLHSSSTLEAIDEPAQLTEKEKAQLNKLVAQIPVNIKEEFELKYEAWKDTWDDPEYAAQSNPKVWTLSDEYKDLIKFCRGQGQTVWPLAIERLFQDDWFITQNLLMDLTLDEYRYLMDDIREESKLERLEGKYPSDVANIRKYAKAILDICSKSSPDQTTEAGLSPSQPSPTIVTVYENAEFTAAERAKLTNLIAQIPADIQQQFTLKYQAWKDTWDDPELAAQSNPKAWTLSDQYKDFIQFCREQGKPIWPMLFQRVVVGDDYFIIENAFVELTLDEYKDIAEKIRLESHRYSEDGKQYIIPAAGTGLKNMLRH